MSNLIIWTMCIAAGAIVWINVLKPMVNFLK